MKRATAIRRHGHDEEEQRRAREDAREDIAQERAVEAGLVRLFESAMGVVGTVVSGAIRKHQRDKRRAGR